MVYRLFVLASLLSPAAAQGSEYWIDPLTGVDAPGNGSQASPFRRMTYALGQHPPSAAGPLTIWLEPGTYVGDEDPADAIDEEQFPLQVPDGTTIRGVLSRGARIDYQLSPSAWIPSAVFRVGYDGESAVVTLRDLEVTTAHRFLQIDLAAKKTLTLSLLDVDVKFSNKALVIHAHEDTSALIWIEGGSMDGYEETLQVEQYARAQLTLLLQRTVVRGRSRITANGALGSNQLFAQETIFRDHGWAGIQTSAQNGSRIDVHAAGCLFTELGTKAGIVPPCTSCAALRDLSPSMSAVTFTISNSIFWGNSNGDVYGHDPATWSVQNCITAQPELLAASPTSFAADPQFLDEQTHDYHLLPTSPAIDAGDTALAGTTDFEGDPRVNVLLGPGAVDIGPDERYARYLYLKSWPTVGGPFVVTTIGIPGATHFLHVAAGTNGQPFGSGVLLAGLLQPESLVVAQLPASGVRSTVLEVPANPSFAGVSFALQDAFLEPGPALTFSANAAVSQIAP